MMKYISNIDQLRNLGYKVKVMHTRNVDNNDRILPKGGETLVILTDPNGHTTEGKARCSSEDGFIKSIGVKIALGRALKK